MRFKKKIFYFLFYAGISIYVIYLLLLTYIFFMPNISIKNSNQFIMYDDQSMIMYQGSKTNEWVNLDEISPYLIKAVLSYEDKGFYQHNGFDYLRIIKALINNLKSDYIVEGASTISQQLVKNMFLSFKKTWSRKFKEALLTIKLETTYSKDSILEGYLNTINYGQGNYGVKSACAYYFNKKPSDLTIEEAAILAGIPKSPNVINPVANYSKSINKAKNIVNNMIKNRIVDIDKNEVFRDEVSIYGHKNNNNSNTIMYYQNTVLKEIEEKNLIPQNEINNGIKIYTYYNSDIQSNLEESINKNMLDDNTQVASIIIKPKTGNIIALTGGRDYAKSQYNRVTDSYRQVGSTIKPILYYGALESGMTASSTFLSEPTTFVFSNNETYSPNNYNNNYGYQNISMNAALAYSENIFAVKTHLFLGTNNLINTAKKLGMLNTLQNNPSVALGSMEINMLDYARTYQTIANLGIKKELSTIKKIENMDGKIIYQNIDSEELVGNPQISYIISEMLTNTYNKAFINYNVPTLISYTNKITHKYAIKTGSTGTDYWVIGYNPELLTLIWNGNDQSIDPLSTVYSKISKNIWIDTMEKSITSNSWYDLPNGVIAIPRDAITGKKPVNNENTILYYYLKGTEPQE